MVGRPTNESPLDWRLEAWNEVEKQWNILYVGMDAPQDDTFRKYNILATAVRTFKKYLLNVKSSTPNSINPGLSHFQLYI